MPQTFVLKRQQYNFLKRPQRGPTPFVPKTTSVSTPEGSHILFPKNVMLIEKYYDRTAERSHSISPKDDISSDPRGVAYKDPQPFDALKPNSYVDISIKITHLYILSQGL